METAKSLQGVVQSESQWHDILRVFLLAQVVGGHLAGIALPSTPYLAEDISHNWLLLSFRLCTRFGAQSAYLFVFLSGYMVAGSLMNSVRHNKCVAGKAFLARRLRRTFPVACAGLLVTLVLDGSAHHFGNGADLYRHSYAYDMVATYSVEHFLGNLLFLQPTLIDSFGSNGPLWTLGYIVQFYVVGWLLQALCVHSRVLGAISLLLVLLGIGRVSTEWVILFCSWVIGGMARHVRCGRRTGLACLAVGTPIFFASNVATPVTSAALSPVIGVLVCLGLRHLPSVIGTDYAIVRFRELSKQNLIVYCVHHPILMWVYAVVFSGISRNTSRFIVFGLVSGCLILSMSAAVSRVVDAVSTDGGLFSRKGGRAI